MRGLYIWTVIPLLFSTTIKCMSTVSDSESQEDDIFAPSGYVLPKQIFNDGKPFYAEKDPISGQFDFSSKKPAGIEPENNEIFDPQEKIVLSSSSPNIHDFLNLPVKYSSSKFVYPLVSSSYANLKYQGNNKNYISSHKNVLPPMATTTTTASPSYYTLPKKDITTTAKQHTTKSARKPQITNQPTVTTFRPSTRPPTTTTITTTETTKATTTTTRHIPSIFDRSTPKQKYIPTKKYSTTASTSTEAPSSTEKYHKYTKFAKHTTTTSSKPETTTITTTTTTKNPETTSTTTAAPSSRNTTVKRISTTRLPSTIAMQNTSPIAAKLPEVPFFPMPTMGPTLTTLDPADVYTKLGQKNEAPMSMADIFNALAGEDQSSGLDNDGNLMEPFSPSKPSPFTLHQVTKAVFPTSTRQPTRPSNKAFETTRPQMSETMQQTASQLSQPSPYDYDNDSSSNSSNSDEYVNYQVQQPNMMQYHTVPSMNNIIISPGQNSASFVLGSQQAVGSSNVYVGSVEKEPLFQKQHHPVQFGTVINEKIDPHQSVQPLHPEYQVQQPNMKPQNPQLESDQETHELLVSSNIRFPSDLGQYVGGSVAEETVNGHAQPLSMQQLQQQGINKPLVFPKPEPDFEVQPNNPVVFKPESTENRPPQKQEVLTLNQQLKNKINFPQLPEDLTPPAPEAPETHTLNEEPQRPPVRSPGHTPSYTRNEFTRKPHPGPHRSDRPLPNILPQFRPNAKLSGGHQPQQKEPGTIRVTHTKYPSYRPPFSHRRQPIGGNRYRLNTDPPQQEANRRVYRVPPPPPSPYFVNRQYVHRFPPQISSPIRLAEGYIFERPSPPPSSLNGIQPVPQSPSQSLVPYPAYYPKNAGNQQTERLAAFEEDDYLVGEPAATEQIKQEKPKLEPVVTLQMLNTQKKSVNPLLTDDDDDDQVGEEPGALQPTSSAIPEQQHGVYVVYPAKALDYATDDLPKPSEDTPNSSADYQNTPFSVVRDQPQEPILMVKNKPPQNKDTFPYPLEKPDPVYAEMINRNRYQAEPRVVNRRQDDSYQSTDVPIAIAYTPTEPSRYYSNMKQNQFSYPNLASQVIPEIRDTQTEVTMAMDDLTDSRGQNFEKDFMAPFYPSMSLGSVTDSPNGWSIFKQQQQQQQQKLQQQLDQQQQQMETEKLTTTMHEKQNINRIDSKEEPTLSEAKQETTTQKYDPDSFQVELQGGFKPIYPPDYHLRDAVDSSELEQILNLKHDLEDEEPIQKSSMTSQAALISTTTPVPVKSTKLSPVENEESVAYKEVKTTVTPLPSNITLETTTSEHSPQRKKTKEPSLVSLLFGDYDEDYEEKPTGPNSNS